MTIEYRTVPQVSSETSLPRLVQNSPRALIHREKNKVEFLEKQFHSMSTKRNLSTLLNFLFPLVFYRRFSILKCKSLVLKNHHMMNARQPFC